MFVVVCLLVYIHFYEAPLCVWEWSLCGYPLVRMMKSRAVNVIGELPSKISPFFDCLFFDDDDGTHVAYGFKPFSLLILHFGFC